MGSGIPILKIDGSQGTHLTNADEAPVHCLLFESKLFYKDFYIIPEGYVRFSRFFTCFSARCLKSSNIRRVCLIFFVLHKVLFQQKHLKMEQVM